MYRLSNKPCVLFPDLIRYLQYVYLLQVFYGARWHSDFDFIRFWRFSCKSNFFLISTFS